jgi:hypothetical protein
MFNTYIINFHNIPLLQKFFNTWKNEIIYKLKSDCFPCITISHVNNNSSKINFLYSEYIRFLNSMCTEY